MTNDAEQYVELMENYTCSMKIFKYERGQGKKVFYKESDLSKSRRMILMLQKGVIIMRMKLLDVGS